MKINYILTTFSLAMFGEGATIHTRVITQEEADRLVDEHTKIIATRVSHERLARNQFGGLTNEVARFASMEPGANAIHISYRGPPVAEDGELPFGGSVILYLVETEEYAEP